MSSNTRKSNTTGLSSATNLLRGQSKHYPIAAVGLAAFFGVSALAAAAPVAAAFESRHWNTASVAGVSWTEHMRDAIRRAHNRLNQRNYSLAGLSLDESIYAFISDYLDYGFNTALPAAGLYVAQAEIVQMHCLALWPEEEANSEALAALLALCPAMIVELGGSVEDLDCD